MTIELVDGKAGTAHISSEDKAIIHQAKFGAGDMVFEWGDAMSCTMQSANKAVIGTGCASIQGLDWHITNPETVTIQSGSSGKNRNDIICAHYHRETSTGVEKVELVAFKGVPSNAAAVDPTIPSAKILNGAADAYMPLWRIPLTGITAGTPVRLFTLRWALWDSVALTATFKFQDTGSFVGALYGGSNTITVKGNMLYVDLSSFKSTVEISDYRVWLYQSGIRPSATIGLGCVGSSLADPHYNKQANWNPDGSITLLGGIGRENILMQRFSMPIPSGVTFS